MQRYGLIASLALVLLTVRPAPAAADLTAFWGVSTSPSTRSAKGVSIGVGLVIVGFEFEYAKTAEDEREAAPELTTSMGNLVLMTPGSGLQLYLTTGGGMYHESLREFTHTSFGTNVGGGAKLSLFGPIRLRLDYRVFSLNGTPLVDRVHRFYGGINLAF
jgi:hypothetical protein